MLRTISILFFLILAGSAKAQEPVCAEPSSLEKQAAFAMSILRIMEKTGACDASVCQTAEVLKAIVMPKNSPAYYRDGYVHKENAGLITHFLERQLQDPALARAKIAFADAVRVVDNEHPLPGPPTIADRSPVDFFSEAIKLAGGNPIRAVTILAAAGHDNIHEIPPNSNLFSIGNLGPQAVVPDKTLGRLKRARKDCDDYEQVRPQHNLCPGMGGAYNYHLIAGMYLGCQLALEGIDTGKVAATVAQLILKSKLNKLLGGDAYIEDFIADRTDKDGKICLELCADVPALLGYVYKQSRPPERFSPLGQRLLATGYRRPFQEFKKPADLSEQQFKEGLINANYLLLDIEYAMERHRAGAAFGAKVCREAKQMGQMDFNKTGGDIQGVASLWVANLSNELDLQRLRELSRKAFGAAWPQKVLDVWSSRLFHFEKPVEGTTIPSLLGLDRNTVAFMWEDPDGEVVLRSYVREKIRSDKGEERLKAFFILHAKRAFSTADGETVAAAWEKNSLEQAFRFFPELSYQLATSRQSRLALVEALVNTKSQWLRIPQGVQVALSTLTFQIHEQKAKELLTILLKQGSPAELKLAMEAMCHSPNGKWHSSADAQWAIGSLKPFWSHPDQALVLASLQAAVTWLNGETNRPPEGLKEEVLLQLRQSPFGLEAVSSLVQAQQVDPAIGDFISDRITTAKSNKALFTALEVLADIKPSKDRWIQTVQSLLSRESVELPQYLRVKMKNWTQQK